MRTIAIVNQKGGCGKTTTAINLSAELAHRSHRTLLIDLDPQGHCAAGLGVPEASIVRGIDDALLGDLRYEAEVDEMLWEVGRGLNLIPSTVRLAGLEAAGGGISERPDRDRRLVRLLEQLESRYDFCIIDCPPTIGLLTFNALRAADETLVPVETGYFALRGAIRQVTTISTMAEKIGRPLDFFLVPTLHDEQTDRSKSVLTALQGRFGDRLSPITIREHEALREAASIGQPIQDFAPDSEAARDFAGLAEWVLGHEQTDIATERAQRLRDAPKDPEAPKEPTPTAPTNAPLPEVLQEPKAVKPTPSRMSSRVADVLHRVRANDPTGAQQGFNLELDRIPRGVLQAAKTPTSAQQSLLVEVSEGGSATTTNDSTGQSRYGAFPDVEGVRFRQPNAGVKSMAVTGDFNEWCATGHPLIYDKEQGCFELVLPLKPGRYEYQLLVDGEPGPDPFAHQCLESDDGANRSVLQIDAPART